MNSRTILGSLAVIAGTIFLICNATILYRGAQRFGHDAVDQLVFGCAAAVVPFAIAIMPELIGETHKRSFFNIVRPTIGTVALIVVWVVFVAYNLANGSGVIGLAREEQVASRSKETSDMEDMRNRRKRLIEQRDALPKHRPADTTAKLIDAEKFKRQYIDSGACADARNKAQRETCKAIELLESEKATGDAAKQLDTEIAVLDGKIASHGPSLASADPQTDLISDATGWGKERIKLWLPASTPIVLELGGAFFWHLGFSTLGWRVRRRADENGPATPQEAPPAPFNPAPLISPEVARRPQAASVESLTGRRKLAEWFFTNCTRPVSAGSMKEAEWYQSYCEICERSGDQPLPVESFRRIASRYVPRIQQIEGETFYQEVLPLIPANA